MLEKEIIKPRSREHWLEERAKDITSTEISALFDLNPYITKFELWHRKKGNLIVEQEGNERTNWGNRLQDAIANGIAQEQGWCVQKKDEYIRVNPLKLGASFDFEVLGMGALLEIKNVDGRVFRDTWLVDGDQIEAPPHIELQVQQQMYVSEMGVAYIGALVGGNSLVLIRRERHEKVIDAILAKSREFNESLESDTPPTPDFSKDVETISKIYNVEPGKIIEPTSELNLLALEYNVLLTEEKDVKARKDFCKARILETMKTAEKVIGPHFTISAGMTKPTRIEAYDRAGFRNFRLNWRKELK